jgi:hypothetical protein
MIVSACWDWLVLLAEWLARQVYWRSPWLRWPIHGFHGGRKYIICVGGRDETYVVRQQRPEYDMFCYCAHKLIRDLLRAAILHEGRVGSVREVASCSVVA